MNTLTSSVDRRRPRRPEGAAMTSSQLASMGRGAVAAPASFAKSAAAASSLAEAASIGASRRSGVIGDAYTPGGDTMHESFGPEAVGGGASYAGGGWPGSHGSSYEAIGGELPFSGSLGRFNVPVPPPAGGDLTPEQALTLYGARLDVTRTQLHPVNRFDPNVIDVRILP